jgi:hypothetical protein
VIETVLAAINLVLTAVGLRRRPSPVGRKGISLENSLGNFPDAHIRNQDVGIDAKNSMVQGEGLEIE